MLRNRDESGQFVTNIEETGETSSAGYEVAVAIVPVVAADDLTVTPSARPSSYLPGYDNAIGRPGERFRALALERGEQAVRVATDALASQIGQTAQRIAAGIGQVEMSPSSSVQFDLDCVEVSFGVTLSAGVQALFTAQAESSAQVTITLTRRGNENSGQLF